MKVDLEMLQAKLSDERFETDPYPDAPHGIKRSTELTRAPPRRCEKCKRKIRGRIEGRLLCRRCYFKPCVYRCGRRVGQGRSICEECAKDADVNPHGTETARRNPDEEK